MPINNVNVVVPATGQSLSTGWAYCSFSAFDWSNKTARIVYDVYADKSLAYQGKPPVKQIEINLSSIAQDGLPSLPDILTDNFAMYANLAQVLDNLLLTVQPDFADGQIEGA